MINTKVEMNQLKETSKYSRLRFVSRLSIIATSLFMEKESIDQKSDSAGTFPMM